MYRDYSRDDPVRDAEAYMMDVRPSRAICEECGEPIRGRTAGYYGDDYYDFGTCVVHEDCLSAYLRKFRKEME